MTDREIFRNNLNFFLDALGYKQKDLAEYVGAKTTTVSGWTRGISYPRADTMEKIAAFFGVSTSQMLTDTESEVRKIEEDYKSIPKTAEAKIISGGIDRMPPERREQALRVLQTIFADYFDGGKDNGT